MMLMVMALMINYNKALKLHQPEQRHQQLHLHQVMKKRAAEAG